MYKLPPLHATSANNRSYLVVQDSSLLQLVRRHILRRISMMLRPLVSCRIVHIPRLNHLCPKPYPAQICSRFATPIKDIKLHTSCRQNNHTSSRFFFPNALSTAPRNQDELYKIIKMVIHKTRVSCHVSLYAQYYTRNIHAISLHVFP